MKFASKYLPIIIPIIVVIVILIVIYYFFKENAWPASVTSVETNRNLDTELVAGQIVEVKYEVDGMNKYDGGGYWTGRRTGNNGTAVEGMNLKSDGDYVIYQGEVTGSGTGRDITWNTATAVRKTTDGTYETLVYEDLDLRTGEDAATWTGSGKIPPKGIPRFPTLQNMIDGTIPSRSWGSGEIPLNMVSYINKDVDGCMTDGEELVNIANTNKWSCSTPVTRFYIKGHPTFRRYNIGTEFTGEAGVPYIVAT